MVSLLAKINGSEELQEQCFDLDEILQQRLLDMTEKRAVMSARHDGVSSKDNDDIL